MMIRLVLFTVVLMLGLARSASAQSPTDGSAPVDWIASWNALAIAAGYRAQLTLVPNTRNVAMVQVGMFEAVNTITPRYTPYALKLKAPAGVAPALSASTVAYTLLARMYPAQIANFDPLQARANAAVTDDKVRADSVAFGKEVAEAMLTMRKDDNVDVAETYRPPATPGIYTPTVVPLGTTCVVVTPWVLKNVDQFRPAAPYKLTSPEYAADLNEVRIFGAKNSKQRSKEQTDTALFWEFTGPGTYGPIARQWAAAKQFDMVDSARFFALFAMATADAYLSVFDAKYEYNLWRPITAIRNGDQDRNPDTPREESWLPLIDTPMHPEYPCAHCIASSTAAAVLASVFGSDSFAPFVLVNPSMPTAPRRYTSLNTYVSEVLNARVWGGIHYRRSAEIARGMGEQVAQQAVRNHLKPL